MRRARLLGTLLVAIANLRCGGPGAVPIPPGATVPLGAWPTAGMPEAVSTDLDRAAADHLVLALGEGDHFVVDKYAYRLALLGRLAAENGVRHVALEMGPSDAGRIDRYLETGDEQWLERVALYGYKGDTDDERRELGPVTRGARRPIDDAWAAAERAFFRRLRALGGVGSDRMHLVGFDYDAVPGGGFADARRAMEPCTPSADVAAVRARLTPPVKTSSDAELQRLAALLVDIAALRDRLAAVCGAAAVTQTQAALAELIVSYRTFLDLAAAQADTSPAKAARVRAVYATREQHMFARLAAYRATLPASTHLVVLAHNMHVARDAGSLRYGRAPSDLPMWPSLGSQIERAQPGQLWVSWLLYGRGSRYAPASANGRSTVTLDPSSLEAQLAAMPGDRYVAVARCPPGSVVDRALPFGTETSEGAGPIRSSVDGLFFLQEATAPSP